MPIDSVLVTKRIKHIRKSKQLRKKDCAKALGVSKETYRSYEDGSKPLSLPELELLGLFLGVTPISLINDDQSYEPFGMLLRKDIRPHYLILRRKMVGALISVIRKNKALSIEDLQQTTQINTENLQAYEKGDTPIPLTDLFLISDHLGISQKALFATNWTAENNQSLPIGESDWYLGLPKDNQVVEEEDDFITLLKALKQLSKSDQAETAKFILNKLRS